MRPLFASVVIALASTARADTLCHGVSAPTGVTDWNTTIQVPRFDPNLGTLNRVDVSFSTQLSGSYGIESLNQSPTTAVLQLGIQVDLRRPDASSIVGASSSSPVFTHMLGTFDGTIDFDGPSGVTQTGVFVLAMVQAALTTPSDLARFSGAPGNPGSVALLLVGAGSASGSGGGNLATFVQTQLGGALSICYDYTPVAAPFCAGDGTNTPCPCGNDSAVGADEGCLNSFGMGAALRGSGIASIAADSLVLTSSNLHGMTTGLFFQGTVPAGGGAGIAFGDGVRCVLGSVARIGTKTASAGTTTYPEAGDAPISVRGSVPPNSTRYYQFWYRNAANFCTSATFNFSQAVAVQWMP